MAARLPAGQPGRRPAETNDAIRGPGTFARILAGIELLAERRYPDFSLNMVVTRLNVGEIAEFDRARPPLRRQDPALPFPPLGRRLRTWEDYRLTRDQLLELSAFLGDHPEILTGDSFFSLTPDSRRDWGCNMCGAAKMTCAVAPDGSVYPCAFLCDPAFLAGNVTARAALATSSGRRRCSSGSGSSRSSLPGLRPLLGLPRRLSRGGIFPYRVAGPSRPGVPARGQRPEPLRRRLPRR